jgi:tetratricopeptide (TPR) repeat protein
MNPAARFLVFAMGAFFLGAVPSAEARDPGREKSSYEANQKGVQFLERGRLKEAVEELEKAYRLNSKNKIIRENLAVAYNNHAVSLMNANRYLEAREFLEKAAGLNPEDKSVADNLTLARTKTGGPSAPPRAGPDPWSLDETGALETIAQDFLLRGIRHFEKKEYKLAKEVLLESLRYSTKNP